jgi:uncharacterized membrane protein
MKLIKKGTKIKYNGSSAIGIVTYINKKYNSFEVTFTKYISNLYTQKDIDNNIIEILN